MEVICGFWEVIWVQGGYLGASGRGVGPMDGQVRWVGTGYVRWLASSSGSGMKVR